MRWSRLLSVVNTLILRGLGSGVAVLFTVLVSRYLQTESAARFFFLFNVSTIAAVCFRWGLDEVIIRRVAKLPSDEVTPVATRLTALCHRRVILWSAACLLTVLVAFRLVSDTVLVSLDLINLTIALSASLFVALTACAARVVQGVGRTNLATVVLNIAVPSLSLLVMLLLISLKEHVYARDLIALYCCAAAVVYLATVVVRYGNPLALLVEGFKVPWRNADSAAANKLGMVVLAQQIMGWTALLIIPYAYGDDVYKNFVVVQKVATLISLTMLAVNFTFSRRFASLYAAAEVRVLRRMVRYCLLAVVGASLAIIMLLVLIRHWLFAYAQMNADVTTLLLILLASQVFFSISALFSVVLSMAHDDHFLFVTQTTINGAGALLFFVSCQFLTLELASALLVASYLSLSLVLGLRVHRLTAEETPK